MLESNDELYCIAVRYKTESVLQHLAVSVLHSANTVNGASAWQASMEPIDELADVYFNLQREPFSCKTLDAVRRKSACVQLV